MQWCRLLSTTALPGHPMGVFFDDVTTNDPQSSLYRAVYVAFEGRSILRIGPLPTAMPNQPALCWAAGGSPACDAPGQQWRVVATGDGSGGALVAWEDWRLGSSNPMHDIYAMRMTTDGSTAPNWPDDGFGVSTVAGGQDEPAITGDGSGGAIIAWKDRRTGQPGIYALRMTGSGAIAGGWSVDGQLLSAGSSKSAPVATTDGSSGAYVAWQEGGGDLYVQRVRGDGTIAPGWPQNGLLVCTAPSFRSVPVLTSDGAGGLLLAWDDLRSGTSQDIYALRVTASGTIASGWQQNGTLVCGASNAQTGPDIIPDNAQGAIIAWTDQRTLSNVDVYCQRVTSSGSRAWLPLDGVALTGPGSQGGVVGLPDGVGGAILAWFDGSSQGVRAGRVNSSGVNLWPPGGAIVSGNPGVKTYLALASDGASGAFVSWLERVSAIPTDPLTIFVQCVSSSGQIDPSFPDGGYPLDVNANGVGPRILTVGPGRAIVAYGKAPGDVYAQCIYKTAGGVVLGVPPDGGAAHRKRVSLLVKPNPSAGAVQIQLDLPSPVVADVGVFSVTGTRVRWVMRSRTLPAGRHTLVWDGRTDSGAPVPPGVYFVRARTGAGNVVGRAVVLRAR